MRVIATAGHVDHGKSTLVRALTGMDPDRFAEEKARGLTIDLGFAWCTLASGTEIAFVDVPGHVRFIKNMLAGVGAVESCMFVVAANEGWMPQSEEHLRILDLLGLSAGVIALTKCGAVDDTTGAVAALDVEERVDETFLDGAEVVRVDGLTGVGLDDLRGALDRLVTGAGPARDDGRPRLWVDRSFAARGSGTVVTGTLTGGSIAVGDDVAVVPGGRGARVRALQSHQHHVERAEPGRRVAINLVGVDRHQVRRGDGIVRRDQWADVATADASLLVLPALDHDVSRRGAYQLHVGSGEHNVRMRVLGPAALAPGESGFVRLHLPVPLPLTPGDRFVLRESGRAETVGGGEILDVAPVLPAAKAAPTRSVPRVVAERGWIDADELYRLTGERRAPVVGRWVVDPAALEAALGELRRAVDGAGAAGLDVARLSDRQRVLLSRLDDVVVDAGRARPGGAAVPAGAGAAGSHPYVLALEASPFAPPPPDGVDRGELRDLLRLGLVIERDGTYFAASAIDQAASCVARLLEASPAGITVAAVRDALGSSRKHVMPLLAHLDATGVTRRRGDLRIAGPRLPTV